MKNPRSNRLPPGITRSELLDAIKRSGYPLQTRVAEALRKHLADAGLLAWVQEEWSYVDADTQELRALDVEAEIFAFNIEQPPLVRPTVDLLIECKQTELPFVFFGSVAPPTGRNFPTCAGLPSEWLDITTDEPSGTWPMLVWAALGVLTDAFVSSPPVRCTTFSKLARRGSKLELSGSEMYHALVLPLTKSVRHTKSKLEPRDTKPEGCHAVVSIAIVDGPMLTSEGGKDSLNVRYSPWVRLLRHETDENNPVGEMVFGIDIVHVAFFDQYLKDHLLPFVNRFSMSVLRHQKELHSGSGLIRGLGSKKWQEFEGALQPATGAATSVTSVRGRDSRRQS